MNNKYVSILGPYINEFINYKHYCGYKYESEINVLKSFDSYYSKLEIKEIKFIREIVEPFLTLKDNERIRNQINKASILRQFGKFLLLNDYIDKLYIIPPISQKGESEYIPYIFTKEELKKILYFFNNYNELVKASKGGFEKDINMLNSARAIIKILMFTGMRISETCKLKLENIDFDNNIIYVDEAKNDNCRLVPFSDSLKLALLEYVNTASIYARKDYNYLFFHISKDNEIKEVTRNNVYFYFKKSLQEMGIKHTQGPRIHDLRHTFATLSLAHLSKTEKDINSSLAYLSTYLGHKSFRETQKYIWMTPDLFNDTLIKMENYSLFIKDIFDDGNYEEQ